MAVDPSEQAMRISSPGASDGAKYSFANFEEGEFSTQLKALDAELGLAVPITPRADICFKSSATPVRNVFELPVPVDAPGAHVTYRFATDGFDICFGIFFQGLDGKMETVLPTTRVESHLEPISGDITVHRPGAVILLWDNSYSWFTTKNLSYSVNLKYPSGAVADKERTARARVVLESAYRDIEQAVMKEAKCKDTCERLTSEVALLEGEVARLQAELAEKQKELETTAEDARLVRQTLEARRAHVLPLLLRALPMAALKSIAAYSSPKDQLAFASKLFAQLIRQAHSSEGGKGGLEGDDGQLKEGEDAGADPAAGNE